MYIRLDCRMVPAGLLGGIRNCMRVFPNMNRSIFWLFRASWLSQKPKTPGFSHQNNWDLWGFIHITNPKANPYHNPEASDRVATDVPCFFVPSSYPLVN